MPCAANNKPVEQLRTVNTSACKGASLECMRESIKKVRGWKTNDKSSTNNDDVYFVIQRESLHKRTPSCSFVVIACLVDCLLAWSVARLLGCGIWNLVERYACSPTPNTARARCIGTSLRWRLPAFLLTRAVPLTSSTTHHGTTALLRTNTGQYRH